MTNYVEHYEKRDYVYPLSRSEIYFKLRTNIKDIVEIDFVYFEKIRQISEQSVLMNCFNVNGSSPYYYGTLKYQETIKYIDYYFKIKTAEKIYYYSPEGLVTKKPTRSFCYSDTNYFDVFETPKWAEGQIGYQIFPDRFNIGSDSNIKDRSKWEDTPTRENFFGGNIKGISEKVEYFKSMDIGIIYLTPIFKSNSNHKYDTIDYFKIDPSFGTENEFYELVKTLHDANIKIILDGVFNHIGYYSQQFQDVIKKGSKSKYYDWFYINGDSVDTEAINYECVGYHKWMPKLRYESKEVREYIKSVGIYWVKQFGIDGWRLDVADEVDYTFWQEYRKAIKSVNKDVILIGETWKNGSDLIRGDELDSIMNYRLRDALLDYIIYSRINIDEFRNRIESIYFDYPKQTHKVLYNTLGSHDTERIMTLCSEDQEKVMLLVSILFSLPGIPFIYYGDEIGLTGENDPLSRRTMNWSEIYNDMHLSYLSIIQNHSDNECIKYGNFKHINFGTNIYSFVRSYQGNAILFIANTGSKKEEIDVCYQEYSGTLTLLPNKSEIIKINKN